MSRLPKHVALIMDGNGRWAKAQGKERVFGHQEGVDSVDKVMEAAAELGIDYITLYAFSTNIRVCHHHLCGKSKGKQR